jgi:hypothetical protein
MPFRYLGTKWRRTATTTAAILNWSSSPKLTAVARVLVPSTATSAPCVLRQARGSGSY